MSLEISFSVAVFVYLLWLYLRELAILKGRGAQIIQGVLLFIIFLTVFLVDFTKR